MSTKQQETGANAGLFRGATLDEESRAYFSSEGGRAVSAFLNERRYTIGEIGVTYRVINHWQSMGLIDEPRESAKGWRKFSVMEAAWLGIITELRAFGFPLEKMAKVKASLEEQLLGRKTGRRVSYFEYHVALVLLKRRPVYLLVFSNGTAEPISFEQLQSSLERTITEHYITLNLNAIVQRIFPKGNLSPMVDRTVEVSDEEAEILFLVRTGNFEKITVSRSDGRIDRVDVEGVVDVEMRIIDILKTEDFQRIEVRQASGTTVSIKRRVRSRK